MTRHAKKERGKADGGEAAAGAADAGRPSAPAAAEEAGAAPAAGECAALRDRLLRLQADFENFRKRTLREREATYRRANEDLMMELLSVLDHFEMGMKTCADHGVDQAVREGFRLVQEQLAGVLGRFGLEPVDAEGEVFDPGLHESIAAAPSGEQPRDHVIHQVRRGYKLGDQLLRPAQVVLSSGPPEPDAPAGEEG